MTASSQKGRARFACIRHGTETRNWRGLEECVEKDAEGQLRLIRRYWVLQGRLQKTIADTFARQGKEA